MAHTTRLAANSAAVPFSRPGSPHAGHRHHIGFIGIGNMGYFMARNLARSHSQLEGSPPLMVWSRRSASVQKLQQAVGSRVVVAENLGQLARACDIIITSLPHDEAVREVYEEMAKILKEFPPSKTKIFVETGTTYPTLAGELDELLSKIPHTYFVTCPVFGLPPVADKAQLLLAVSGGVYHARKEVAHLLCPAMGRKVIDLGERPEKAPTFKLIGNSMVMGMTEVMAEAFTLAEKAGIGADMAYGIVKDLLPAPPMVLYGEKMIHDQFDGKKGYAIDGGVKDATYIRRLAAANEAPMAAIDISYNHFLSARSWHAALMREGKSPWDVLDTSALIVGSRVNAGLDGFDSNKHAGLVREDE